jgi:hypothetical protein
MVRFHNDMRFLLVAQAISPLAVATVSSSPRSARRSPNRAVPIRTSVLPSATATSRSSDIPIEHTSSPSRRPGHGPADESGSRRLGPPVVGPTVISPSTTSPARRRPRRTPRPRRAGSRPCPARRWCRPGRGRAHRDRAGRSRSRAIPVDGLVASTTRPALAHLVRLQPPDEVDPQTLGSRGLDRNTSRLASSSWA